MDKTKLKTLIASLLKTVGSIHKVKLAKLVLFAEIEHFRMTGESYTGLYFVRLRKGPVVAFFDDILEEETGNIWEKKTSFVPIFEEGMKKVQYSYSLIKDIDIPEELQKTIKTVNSAYSKKSGTKLSTLSHNLPAWKYSEPNEPIYVAELAIKKDAEYFNLIDLIEDIDEEDDELLSEKISQYIPTTEGKI